jgi:tRNA modification GTPase
MFSAVMTSKAVGAISSIQVFGDKAGDIIKKIFIPQGKELTSLQPGRIYVGNIIDGSHIVDQVTLGCEERDSVTINCHGNPLIVSDIMKLLSKNNVTALTANELLAKIEISKKPANTIELEAKLEMPKAQTLQGTKIIANQIQAGLSQTANNWLHGNQSITEAEKILEDSKIAGLIINGCSAVLAGPANSGKSTLLNRLTGREKAIVSHIKGTTRDWVTGKCHIGPLSLSVIDTAGLDEKLTGEIEKQSQQRSIAMLQSADLVLLVLDISESNEQISPILLERISEKKIVTILNKSDLPTKFNISKLPEPVKISAKSGDGIDKLTERILQICGVIDFDLRTAVCITERQQQLLGEIVHAKSKSDMISIIKELLNGQLSV